MSANGSSGLCWAHDPKNREKRRKGQSRGGKSKPSREIQDLKKQLEDLTTRVVEGELETSKGAVANQLISTRIRLLEFERRLKELEEIEERLAELEAQQTAGGGYQSWRR